ncbi:histone deacetylase complex protein [Fomitopsis serialis]|uniref:histone deacetylase complex protein n=1 Tax=Fomitopsis serialis TaxID=139415 RepID=UPI002008381B|nr:histone deacetylase complex protein [Neoantrodia serialis]KAH9918958.1 histone deacetylase complex protein [Neoantrodia serialis]
MDKESEHVRRVCYIVSNELVKASSLLPSNSNRSLLVHALVKAYGLLDPAKCPKDTRLQVLRPVPADDKELGAYHTQDYLQFVLNPANGSAPDDPNVAEFGLEEDCPPFAGLSQYVRLVAGGTLTAASALREDRADIAICWDGGRHHARKSEASGFCYVADCILAMLTLKRMHRGPDSSVRRPRVMYLDLDLHFSDAVSEAFLDSSATSLGPQILTLSIHHSAPGFFPSSSLATLRDPSADRFDPFTLSMPLERGATDATFAQIWPSVERVKEAFQPECVIVQCGVDGLAGDPHGIWNWSLNDGEGSMGWCIDRVCNRWGCKVLMLGGGGYNHPNAARAWAYMTSVALGRPLQRDADVPDHGAFPLYAPSFTLDVPAGNASDRNDEAHVENITEHFERVAQIIEERMYTGN